MAIIGSLCAVLALWYVAVVVVLRRGLGRLGKAADDPVRELFSVVIAARNEENHIEACLASVLAQSVGTGRFEVIVVDDRSTDRTAQRVCGLCTTYANLRLLRVEQTPAGVAPKKHALAVGIASARNPIVVFTDADCRVGPGWLETIGRHMDSQTGLVQGITTYWPDPTLNRVFWGLQSVDFLSHGIVAAAAIGAGVPINSNANNFAVRRVCFEALGGYGAVQGVVSGDDDLLLQRVWREGRWRIRFMADAAGAVSTAPTPTLGAVLNQRTRWGSKTVHYAARQVVMLAGIFLFYLAIAACAVGAIAYLPLALPCVALLVVKMCGELVLMIPGTRLFNACSLRPYIMPASVLQLPLVLYAVFRGVFGTFEWKGLRSGRTMS